MRIRAVTADDAAALLEIYAYYVEKTAITYEYDVPSVAEFAAQGLGICEGSGAR